jgi:hypothetical protein
VNKKSGETAECYFDYLAMVQGLVVSEPRGDSAPYDRIVEKDGKLFKVQIKMRSSHNKVKQKNYLVAINKADGSPYTPKEVDIVAIHLRNEDYWYFIPIKFITKRLRINPVKDKFDKYKNNWNVFR